MLKRLDFGNWQPLEELKGCRAGRTSLKGKAADNTAYVFNANCPRACTFWADFVTSLDFVLFVHIKPEAAGAHSQPAVNTFKKTSCFTFFFFFFASFYGYYKSTKILYDLWMPDMYGRIILLGEKSRFTDSSTLFWCTLHMQTDIYFIKAALMECFVEAVIIFHLWSSVIRHSFTLRAEFETSSQEQRQKCSCETNSSCYQTLASESEDGEESLGRFLVC